MITYQQITILWSYSALRLTLYKRTTTSYSKDQAVESIAKTACNAYQGQRRLIAQIVIADLAIIFQYFPTKLKTYRIHLVPFGVLDELLERND